MEKDTIISLGDYEFALLDEVILDNQKYFFAVQMVKGTDNITDNYYYFKEELMAYVNKKKQIVFRLGDKVRVKCIGASKEERTVDFTLVKKVKNGNID